MKLQIKMTMMFLMLFLSLNVVRAQQNIILSQEQVKVRKNVIFVEPLSGGSGSLGTLNYTRVLWATKYFFADTKIGVSFYNVSFAPSINIGSKNHYLHLGYGGTFGRYAPYSLKYITGINDKLYLFYPNIGYKYHPSKGHLYLGLYYMPHTVRYYVPGGHAGPIYTTRKLNKFALGIGWAFK